MIDAATFFLDKASESLTGAENELAAGRHNNCANRCYYACFQAAVAALLQSGMRRSGGDPEWSHAFVQARFVGDLITRRKRYSADLRDVLSRTLFLRRIADYKAERVSQTQAARAVRNARRFVEAIRAEGGQAG